MFTATAPQTMSERSKRERDDDDGDDLVVGKRANTFQEAILLNEFERMALEDKSLSPFDETDAAEMSAIGQLPKLVLINILSSLDLASVAHLCNASNSFAERVCASRSTPSLLRRERQRLLRAVEEMPSWRRQADIAQRDPYDLIVDYVLRRTEADDDRFVPEIWEEWLERDFGWHVRYNDDNQRVHGSRLLAQWRVAAFDAAVRYGVKWRESVVRRYRETTASMLSRLDQRLTDVYYDRVLQHGNLPSARKLSQHNRTVVLREFYQFCLNSDALQQRANYVNSVAGGLVLFTLHDNQYGRWEPDTHHVESVVLTPLPVVWLLESTIVSYRSFLRIHAQLFAILRTTTQPENVPWRHRAVGTSYQLLLFGERLCLRSFDLFSFFGDNALVYVIEHVEIEPDVTHVYKDVVGGRYVISELLSINTLSIDASDADRVDVPSNYLNSDLLDEQMRNADRWRAENSDELMLKLAPVHIDRVHSFVNVAMTPWFGLDVDRDLWLNVNWNHGLIEQLIPLSFVVRFARVGQKKSDATQMQIRFTVARVREEDDDDDVDDDDDEGNNIDVENLIVYEPKLESRFKLELERAIVPVSCPPNEPCAAYLPGRLLTDSTTHYYTSSDDTLAKTNYFVYQLARNRYNEPRNLLTQNPTHLWMAYFEVDSKLDVNGSFGVRSLQFVQIMQDINELAGTSYVPFHNLPVWTGTWFRGQSMQPQFTLRRQFYYGRQLRWIVFELRFIEYDEAARLRKVDPSGWSVTLDASGDDVDYPRYYQPIVLSWDIVSNQIVSYEYVQNQTVPPTYRNASQLQLLGTPATVRTAADLSVLASL